MMKWIIVFFAGLFFTAGCTDKNNENDFKDRERNLQLRIDSFQLVEKEYQSLLKMRDSILKLDSLNHLNDSLENIIKVWPNALVGRWSSKLVCIESDCSDYVIGDQRVDTWNFKNDSLSLQADLLDNKDKIIRTYDAVYSGNEILLSFTTDTSTPRQMSVKTLLNEINASKLRGTHTIKINKDCTAKFSIELTRPLSNTKKQ